jgi:hypothetical protein
MMLVIAGQQEGCARQQVHTRTELVDQPLQRRVCLARPPLSRRPLATPRPLVGVLPGERLGQRPRAEVLAHHPPADAARAQYDALLHGSTPTGRAARP